MGVYLKMKGINKAFFGQDNALKIQYNTDTNEVYLHLGKVHEKVWTWYRAKLNDVELGNIIQVLVGKINHISFFHKFNSNPQQIFVDRSKNGKTFAFRIGSMSKALNEAEAYVLKILIESLIVKLNSHPLVISSKDYQNDEKQ